MDSPVIQNGAVAFSGGRIIAVGSFQQIKSAHPDAEFHDLGDAIVLPGLVNPHTHLELSDCNSESSAGLSFTDWILNMRRQGGAGRFPEGDSDRVGSMSPLRCDMRWRHYSAGRSDATVIAQSPLRCVSFGEVLGLAKRRWRFEELLPIAIDRKHETDRLRIGISPHAPFTVDLEGYRQCLELARHNSLPVATHLAENPEEQDFLQSHSGPFRQLWNDLDSWQDDVPTYRGSPIDMAKAIGLLDYPTLLAHVNYCNDREMNLLAKGQASVVYCPRTHAYFGHPPHRWREMLARGVNVAVGTDGWQARLI